MIRRATSSNRSAPADGGLAVARMMDGGLGLPTPPATLGDPLPGSLLDQIFWLISLRWIAVAAVVVGTLIGTYLFPILADPWPLYATAAVLLACNFTYFVAAGSCGSDRQPNAVALAMVQMEVDLLVLTAVLHFSGGAASPFLLFYVFHVIIATIILPRNLSFAVGLTAIALFGLLTINELNAGTVVRLYPLQLSTGGGLWRNPIYGLAAYVAFVCTVMIAQYLTRIILARLTAKELEAARNSNVLQAIINAMSEGLIFTSVDGRVVLCNPAAERWRLDGTPPKTECGRDFPAALQEHLQALANPDASVPERDTVIEFCTRGPTPRLITAQSCLVTGGAGVPLGYVVVGQDQTEHKKLEADLLARTEQVTAINETLKMSRIRMAQREKMVALGQMAAGIAHEIGNPLTSLSSVVQYLGRKCKDPEQQELCAVVGHHVGRISEILRRMLNHARPAASEYKWVNVNEVIQNTLALIRLDQRATGVTITDVPNPELPTAWLSPQNLEQCLLNVAINALDAMAAKGPGAERRLDVTKNLQEDMIEIRIRDTGIGMSPEVCRRAFESFFTTKEISKGTGLGLFVTYNLITEMDGTIALESECGRGTTVLMRLPVRPKQSLLAEPSPATDPSHRAGPSSEPCF